MKLFKNIPLIIKLLFLIIPSIAALLILGFYITGTSEATYEKTETLLYTTLYQSSSSLINADRDFYQAYVAEIEAHNDGAEISSEALQSYTADFDDNLAQVIERVTAAFDYMAKDEALYKSTKHETLGLTVEEIRKKFDADIKAYQDSWSVKTPTEGDWETHQAQFETIRDYINTATEILEVYAEASNAANDEDFHQVNDTAKLIVIIVAIAITVLSIIIFSYILWQIRYITKVSERIADGDFGIKIAESHMGTSDLGKLAVATSNILKRLNEYTAYIKEVSETLSVMSTGDMRVSLKLGYQGEFMPLKRGLESVISSMRHTLTQITASSEQVHSAAAHVANASSELAHGASEQTQSIESLQETITSIAAHAEQNMSHSAEAKKNADSAESLLITSNKNMDEMLEAMEEITNASDEIGKIIAVIDNIAFQTNILALNASVEAARAGEAGKGFAVVADEVRNLANKSAEAAKNTSALIEQSITAVNKGQGIAKKTAEAMHQVEEKSKDTLSGVDLISEATVSQNEDIHNISEVISRISSVVHNNAATAEETSAASEELSAQADNLSEEVSKFKL
ncbi:MAG: methyl-accepting chemotaxis protein [Ruminococcus sp.]|nr:methyl-accepting chemotaxis protein [Ruminococcus sp.]